MNKLNPVIHKKDHTERVIGRKAKGPQTAGGNKLQFADGFILFLHQIKSLLLILCSLVAQLVKNSPPVLETLVQFLSLSVPFWCLYQKLSHLFLFFNKTLLHKKAPSDQASSLTLDQIPLLWRPWILMLFMAHSSNTSWSGWF